MRSDEEKKFLFDIVDSIERIEAFVEHLENYTDYNKYFKSKYATERMLIIVGEAVYRLKQKHNVTLLHSDQIYAFRNRLVHAYDNINDTIVWTIIKEDLPKLKHEVTGLLQD